jgi:hypothetical protein
LLHGGSRHPKQGCLKDSGILKESPDTLLRLGTDRPGLIVAGLGKQRRGRVEEPERSTCDLLPVLVSARDRLEPGGSKVATADRHGEALGQQKRRPGGRDLIDEPRPPKRSFTVHVLAFLSVADRQCANSDADDPAVI